MAEKYLSDNGKIIKKILALAPKSEKILKKFIENFYITADPKYLDSVTIEDLYASAKNLYDFIQKRQSSKHKVRVYNPTKQTHGYNSDRTIVECNLDDSPFILDSITAYLFQDDRILHEVIHPIFRITRDSKSQIKNLTLSEHEDVANKAAGDLESVIQIQISHITSKDEHKRIAKDLEDVLECVYHAVADWKPMMAQVNKTIDSLAEENPKSKKATEAKESEEFLKWALDGNFIFLGYREFDYTKKKVSFFDEKDLGIFKASVSRENDDKLKKVIFNKELFLKFNNILEVTKSSRKSPVHRPAHMDYIGVKLYDDKGKVIGEERYLGLFTSKVYYQSAHNIPIIRNKIEHIIDKSNFNPDSHNGKALVAVLEGHPRDELLQSTEEELFDMSMGIVSLSERPATRLFIRRDRFLRFYSCIIFIPREFFTTYVRENIQKILTTELGGTVMDYFTQITDSPLARVNILISNVPKGVASDYLDSSNEEHKGKRVDVKAIEQKIIEKTNSWLDNLSIKLIDTFGEIEGENIFRNYSKSFPESYKDIYHPGGATLDIEKLEKVYENREFAINFDLYHLQEDVENTFQLKLYTFDRITLSDILPVIENIGFKAIDERSFAIHPKHQDDQISLYHYKLHFDDSGIDKKYVQIPTLKEIKHKLEEVLLAIWNKEIENDSLNRLVSRAGLNARQINMLRAFAKYILQLNYPYSKELMYDALCRNPVISREIVEYFYAKFDVSVKQKDRSSQIDKKYASIKKLLQKVTSVTEDRILTQFLDTIKATLRTNYFQTDDQADNKGDLKNYLAIKLDSKSVPNIPQPVMYAEIFVYSYDVEAIHLRGGKVARGGLRWSDRNEDFRTEVLGLVKAQMVKNSVIVPVGSKGGFVVKNPPKERSEFLAKGQECYKTFLSGMLDITDNIIKDKIVKPKNVIPHDGDDPYLVVAADKGTATFSDIANGVSEKYNFWLGDAFASGGSVGYDHKKMGITARGAWISVIRHFREMGIDCQEQDFTCAGIGDMGGDVFGNGMLLSKHTRLVAAFNHLHIFIDPNPDAAKSYKERERLFKLPKSSWEDYNKKLISKGGGVFSRSSKAIKISKEIAELLNVSTPSMTPEELISAILRSEVDLIWNGGIGTYIKASTEGHDQVGDKANDSLRVNANEVRAKIIGEGGNLGLTQLARIEYARNGGRINTDAIDNSAGVDCSDHEVNIKIALSEAVAKKRISMKSRNKLLEDMTDNVAELVLRDNELQTQAITIAENQHNKIVEDNIRLMEYLEKNDRLNRNLEFLPSNNILYQRANSKQGFTRPELSVVLAYSKNYIFDDLVNSSLPDDDYFEYDLVSYFPEKMRAKFESQIKNHPLKREIVATIVSNSIVNRTGTTFFHRLKEETGLKGCDVARAYAIVRDCFGLRNIWQEIEATGNKISLETMIELYNEVELLIERASGWFLRNMSHPLKTGEIVDNYAPKIAEISKVLSKITSKVIQDSTKQRKEKYISQNVPEEVATKIAELDVLASAPDIVMVAEKTDLPVKIVGKIYFEMGDRLKIGWLRLEAKKLLSDIRWDNLAVKTLISIFYDQQMRLTEDVVNKGFDKKSTTVTLEKWLEGKKKVLGRYANFIIDLQTQERITNSMLTVAVERVNSVLSGS